MRRAVRRRTSQRRVPAPRSPESIERLIERQPWDRLAASLAAAGAEVATTTTRLRGFLHGLVEWNRGASNLVARGDEPRLVERHLVESLTPASWMAESGARRWLDFGSGAGLPAIPLALAGIGSTWTLVESRRSKVLFMLKYLQDSGLQNIEVIHDRLENVVEARPAGEFDGFTSRATMTLSPTLVMAAPLVKSGGVAFLWKGSGRDEELRADPRWMDDWEHDGTRVIGEGPTAVMRFIRK